MTNSLETIFALELLSGPLKEPIENGRGVTLSAEKGVLYIYNKANINKE